MLYTKLTHIYINDSHLYTWRGTAVSGQGLLLALCSGGVYVELGIEPMSAECFLSIWNRIPLRPLKNTNFIFCPSLDSLSFSLIVSFFSLSSLHPLCLISSVCVSSLSFFLSFLFLFPLSTLTSLSSLSLCPPSLLSLSSLSASLLSCLIILSLAP